MALASLVTASHSEAAPLDAGIDMVAPGPGADSGSAPRRDPGDTATTGPRTEGRRPPADGSPPDGGVPEAAAYAPAARDPLAPESVRVLDRRPYILLGHGVRRGPGLDLYMIALYVDEVGARRAFPALASRAGGRSREKLLGGDRAPPFVVWGDFEKLAVVRLLRDAPSVEVCGILQEGLEALLSDRAAPELRDRARALLALFDRDLRRGDTFELHTSPSGLLEVRVGQARHAVATDARLARAVWEIWLGGRPVQLDLRRALIDRVELLGR